MSFLERSGLLGRNSVFLSMLGCALGAMCGCVGGRGSDLTHAGVRQDPVLIAPEYLPPGWKLVPDSRMPLNDRVPWWQTNPQTLDAPLPVELALVRDGSSAASRVRAAAYENGDHWAVIFWVKYPSVESMAGEFDIFAEEISENGLIGVDREDRNALIVMAIPLEAPGRSYFVNRFHSLASSVRGCAGNND